MAIKIIVTVIKNNNNRNIENNNSIKANENPCPKS